MNRIIFLYFCIISIASAKLPVPALTLLGGLFQEVDAGNGKEVRSIIPSANDHFQIVAIRDGVGIISKANVDSSRGDNLVLMRVPRDDGTDPRAEEYFLRTGETVRFEVWYWLSPSIIEGEEPDRKFMIVEGDYTLQSGSGGVIPRSFTIINNGLPFTNISGNGTFEDWAANLPNSWAWPSGADRSADGDPDGDGLTNFQEWILGLDPTTQDAFTFDQPELLPESDPDTNSALLKMKPTLVGRTYHIYRLSADIAIPEGAEPIHSYTPEVDSGDTWYQYIDVHNDEEGAFWRVLIEINN